MVGNDQAVPKMVDTAEVWNDHRDRITMAARPGTSVRVADIKELYIVDGRACGTGRDEEVTCETIQVLKSKKRAGKTQALGWYSTMCQSTLSVRNISGRKMIIQK